MKVNTSEGGFLSGRNPLEFNPAAPLPTFIIQLLVIVVACRLVKLILTPIKQPAVIAEIIAGILLGPTGLGHFPQFSHAVFPPKSLPFLGLMANFGLVLFLFMVGLELDPKLIKQSIRRSFIISVAGMCLPFVGGVGVSYLFYLYVEPANHVASFPTYLLFLGVAMAITAFPVLARILTELSLLHTKVGSVTISAAAVDDATSWCLLALVVSLINAGSALIALYVFLIGLGYTSFLILVFRPLYVYFLRRVGALEGNEPSQFVVFLTLLIVFASAFITDAIGIHAIFGGFVAGIIIPHESNFAYHITHKIEDLVTVLLLPLYFTLSGLKTKISSINDPTSWGIVLLVIFVACAGKIIGCTLAARLTRMNWRESLTVGFLMNCKGLVELIVLNLGYDAGVISDKTFAIMVIMALVTTFLTVPVVRLIYPPEFQDDETSDANHVKPLVTDPKMASQDNTKVLVSVTKVDQVPPIFNIVQLLFGDSTTSKPADPKPVLNVLKLSELSERNSSVILTQSGQILPPDDPILNMFAACDQIIPIDIVGIKRIVPVHQFPKILLSVANELSAARVIVPWVGHTGVSHPITTQYGNSLEPGRRRQSMHRSSVFSVVQNSLFLKNVVGKWRHARATILILVDRGLETVLNTPVDLDSSEIIEEARPKPSIRKIFLPFFGGPDDRAALSVVVGIAAQSSSVSVEIMRFLSFNYKKGGPGPKSVTQSLSEVFKIAPSETGSTGISENKNEAEISVRVDVPVSDTADEIALTNLFGNPAPNSRVAINSNLVYSVSESFNPIQHAVSQMGNMRDVDLIVLGRGVPLKRGGGDDSERRCVLGDVSESILQSQSTASLLVVQAGKKS